MVYGVKCLISYLSRFMRLHERRDDVPPTPRPAWVWAKTVRAD